MRRTTFLGTAVCALHMAGIASTLVSCEFPLRELKLAPGEDCENDDACQSGFCELSSDDQSGGLMCCSTECPTGTWCHPTGSRCVGCQGSACFAGCEESGCELGLGAPCDDDAQCRSEICEPDDSDLLRCCEPDCVAEGRGCDEQGQCLCPPYEEWDGARCRTLLNGGENESSLPEPLSSLPPTAVMAPDAEDFESLPGSSTIPTEESRVPPGTSEPMTPNSDIVTVVPNCGDGASDQGEECDGGQSCTEDCLLIECGNSRLDPGEECESNDVDCNDVCRRTSCGNGRIDAPDEECDPPNVGNCTAECLLSVCGDGSIDGMEQCEPPDTVSCDSHCRVLTCSDSTVEDPECDPLLDDCTSQCGAAVCGDGWIGDDEECDPPAEGVCGADCLDVVCGNGRLDDGEACEASVSSAACSRYCTLLDESGVHYTHTFDNSLQGFQLLVPSARASDALGLQFAADPGDPSPGSLHLSGQLVDLERAVIGAHFTDSIDIEDGVLVARVMTNSEAPVEARLFAKSGAGTVYIAGPWTPLQANWVSVSLEPGEPTLYTGEFDTGDVGEIGVEIVSASAGAAISISVSVDSVGLL